MSQVVAIEAESTLSLPWPLIAGMMLAAALAPLGSTMIAVALPAIGHDLDTVDADLTQWLVASYLIAGIALQSPGGKMGDLIGHRRALTAGLCIYAVGGALGLALATLPALVAARILMAAGGAAIVPAAMAIVRNHVPMDRRASAFGFFGAGMGIAAAIGPLIGGELTDMFGWRAIFAVNLPVIGLALFLVMAFGRALDETAPTGPHPRLDLGGGALLGVGLTLAIVAVQIRSAYRGWIALAGGALLAVFPLWERRAQAPVVDFALFRSRAFSAAGAIIALQNLAMYTLLFQLPIFFRQVRGEGAKGMGRALLAMTLAMVVSSVVAGRLSQIIGARVQVFSGSLVALGGLWWVHDPSVMLTPLDVVPGLVMMGIGVGLSAAPSQAAAMAASRRDNSGMAAGILATMRYLGGVAGIAALGRLLVDAATLDSHRAPILLYAAALLGSAMLALLLPQGTRREAAQVSHARA